MFASLIRTAWLFSGQAGVAAQPDADTDYFWFFIGVAGAVVGVLWLLVKVIPVDAKPPQSVRSSRAPAMPNRSCAQRLRTLERDTPPRSQRSLPRRVIRLHEVTPGQSEHEYNVGDPLGTRGSALVRAA